jgi:hypothetical protein
VPAGVDEKKWKQAKKAAGKAGQKGNFAYVMGTYQHIAQHTGSHKPKKSKK